MALILTPRQLTQRAELYHQLGQLTAAGVGLTNSLELLSRNPPARSYRAPLQKMVEHLGHGETYGESLLRLGRWTPEFDIALLSAGEKSGRLDAVFKMLGTYYAERARLLRQMITDLAYPLFVFHLAIFLFPFIQFFADNNLHAFLLKSFGVLIPLYAVVFGIIFATQGRRGATWRAVLERLMRPVPVLGTARHFLALSRLAAALEALLNAGVTVIEAWDLAAAASGSPALMRAVAAWKPGVVAGVTPADAVGASAQFPEVFANLYRSGEMSGQLDETLQRLHVYYNEEGTRKLHLLAKWVPQFLYLCVAAYVGYKVISFYTGYFDQIQKIGGF
jgi:type II secretory pathway component PulF